MKDLIKELREDPRLTFTLIGILIVSIAVALLMLTVSKSALKVRYRDNMNYGYYAMSVSDYGAAIEAFENAYNVNPTHDAAVELAKAWFKQGDTTKAIQVVTSRMELYESTPELEALLEKYKEAIGYYKTVDIAGKTINRKDTAIYLSDVTLTEEDKQNLTKFENLVTLSLENCGLTDIAFLENCTKLMSVTLSSNPISDFSPLESSPDLRTLYIDNTAISEFTQLHRLTGLTTLSIVNVWMTVEQRDAISAALPQCTVHTSYDHMIETLTLGGVSFFTDDTEINLSGLSIKDVSPLNKCIKLEKLNLSNNDIGWIARPVKIPTLTHLDLSGNTLSNIEALKELTNLTVLNLNGNSVTTLKPLAALTQLTELYLSGNPIYHGHNELAKLPKLQKLDLSETLLQDKYLECIPMDAMTELDLRNNPALTEEAIKEFAAAHPNCTIHHDFE